jgi:hypothetical protein
MLQSIEVSKVRIIRSTVPILKSVEEADRPSWDTDATECNIKFKVAGQRLSVIEC